MKILLIIVCLLILTKQATIVSAGQVSQCSCKNAMQQLDCLKDYCNWDATQESCTNKPCAGFTQSDCLGVPDPFNCIWNYTQSKCEIFTKCSDYSFAVDQSFRCNDLIKCQADLSTIDNTAGTIKCKDRILDAFISIDNCDLLSYKICYWNLTPDGKQCVQNAETEKCEARAITKCSDYKTKDNCNILACFWNDSSVCEPITCKKLTQEDCSTYFTIDSKSAIFCQWNGNACVDLDVSTLTQKQCFEATHFTYGWNMDTEKCGLCVTNETNSNAHIVLIEAILLAIILN